MPVTSSDSRHEREARIQVALTGAYLNSERISFICGIVLAKKKIVAA